MSITNYSELKQAVADYLHRTDLTAKIPDFITLMEARLNDVVLMKDMETEATLSTVSSSRLVPLPTGYISPIALWLLIGTQRELIGAALPQEMPYSPDVGLPEHWAIDGANILLDKPSQGVQTLYFRYLKKSNLSDTTTTNEVLSRRPDVYLFGTLSEACQYLFDDENYAKWEQKFQEAVKTMKDAENRARAMVPLRTEFGQILADRFNIYRGY